MLKVGRRPHLRNRTIEHLEFHELQQFPLLFPQGRLINLIKMGLELVRVEHFLKELLDFRDDSLDVRSDYLIFRPTKNTIDC